MVLDWIKLEKEARSLFHLEVTKRKSARLIVSGNDSWVIRFIEKKPRH